MSNYNWSMKIDKTIYQIGRIREKANDFILKELKQVGVEDVAPSHGDILVALFHHKELPMTEIANSIHRDRSTVTTLINKLLKQGYVLAKKDPNDSRSTIISLTQKGKELESSFLQISRKLYEVEYKGISDEEKEIFQNVLKKVLDNF